MEAQLLVSGIDLIYTRIQQGSPPSNSLYSGSAGMAIFLAYYYKKTGSVEAYNLMVEMLQAVIEDIENYDGDIDFVDGLLGKIYGLNLVNEIMDRSFFDDGFFGEFEEIAFQFVLQNFKNGDYDLFYGAGGGLLTYLAIMPPGEKRQAQIRELYEALYSSSLQELSGDHLWLDYMNIRLKRGRSYNLGLAHGQPSIWILFTWMASELGPEYIQQTIKLIEEALVSFRKYQLDHGDPDYSRYPTEIFVNEHWTEIDPDNRRSSKLAWCYGDLCIGQALTLIGKSLNHQPFIDEGVELAKYTLHRSSLESAALEDACLCHGTTSCALLYKSLHEMTKDPDFEEAAEHWLELTETFREENGYHFEPVEDTPVNPYSLLEGNVGVGLTYFDALGKEFGAWKTLFLTY
jgi:lantibiotic modifying enzyme